jgi:hypothetical protein
MDTAVLLDPGAWGRLMGLRVDSDPLKGCLTFIGPCYAEHVEETGDERVPERLRLATATINKYIHNALHCDNVFLRREIITRMLAHMSGDAACLDLILSPRPAHIRLRAMIFHQSLVAWWAELKEWSLLRHAAVRLLKRATSRQLLRKGCRAWMDTMEAVRTCAGADTWLGHLPADVVEVHLLPLLGDVDIDRAARCAWNWS